MDKKLNKKLLFDYLKSQHTMSLATYAGELGICTVFYAIDDDWNIYFVSPEDTHHSRNIFNNSSVACNIVNTNQVLTDKKVGAQVYGSAERIKGLDMIKQALNYWQQVNSGASGISFENIKNNITEARMWKIIPGKIQFFNQELYGDDEYEVFEF